MFHMFVWDQGGGLLPPPPMHPKRTKLNIHMACGHISTHIYIYIYIYIYLISYPFVFVFRCLEYGPFQTSLRMDCMLMHAFYFFFGVNRMQVKARKCKIR